MLQIADKASATVLSNDSFQEFHGTYDWLFDDGRLIGGKPVRNVGWVFVMRTPVRGPTSRRATRGRPDRQGDAPSSRATADGEASSATQRRPARHACRSQARRRARRSRAAERRKAAPADCGSGGDDTSFVREEGSPAPWREHRLGADQRAGAVPGFVEAHPVGSVANGTVDRFSSHGAYAVVDGALCYVPLEEHGRSATGKGTRGAGAGGGPSVRGARRSTHRAEASIVALAEPAQHDRRRRRVHGPGHRAPAPTNSPGGSTNHGTSEEEGNGQTGAGQEEGPAPHRRQGRPRSRRPCARRRCGKQEGCRAEEGRERKERPPARRRPPRRRRRSARRAKKAAAKRKAPAKKARRAKTTAKKAPAKRAPAKKTAAKKAPRSGARQEGHGEEDHGQEDHGSQGAGEAGGEEGLTGILTTGATRSAVGVGSSRRRVSHLRTPGATLGRSSDHADRWLRSRRRDTHRRTVSGSCAPGIRNASPISQDGVDGDPLPVRRCIDASTACQPTPRPTASRHCVGGAPAAATSSSRGRGRRSEALGEVGAEQRLVERGERRRVLAAGRPRRSRAPGACSACGSGGGTVGRSPRTRPRCGRRWRPADRPGAPAGLPAGSRGAARTADGGPARRGPRSPRCGGGRGSTTGRGSRSSRLPPRRRG